MEKEGFRGAQCGLGVQHFGFINPRKSRRGTEYSKGGDDKKVDRIALRLGGRVTCMRRQGFQVAAQVVEILQVVLAVKRGVGGFRPPEFRPPAVVGVQALCRHEKIEALQASGAQQGDRDDPAGIHQGRVKKSVLVASGWDIVVKPTSSRTNRRRRSLADEKTPRKLCATSAEE